MQWALVLGLSPVLFRFGAFVVDALCFCGCSSSLLPSQHSAIHQYQSSIINHQSSVISQQSTVYSQSLPPAVGAQAHHGGAAVGARAGAALSKCATDRAGLVFRYRVLYSKVRTYTARQGTQRKRKCRSHDILFSLAVVELVVHQPAQRRVRVHASDAHHAVRLVDAELGTTLADSRQPGEIYWKIDD